VVGGGSFVVTGSVVDASSTDVFVRFVRTFSVGGGTVTRFWDGAAWTSNWRVWEPAVVDGESWSFAGGGLDAGRTVIQAYGVDAAGNVETSRAFVVVTMDAAG